MPPTTDNQTLWLHSNSSPPPPFVLAGHLIFYIILASFFKVYLSCICKPSYEPRGTTCNVQFNQKVMDGLESPSMLRPKKAFYTAEEIVAAHGVRTHKVLGDLFRDPTVQRALAARLYENGEFVICKTCNTSFWSNAIAKHIEEEHPTNTDKDTDRPQELQKYLKEVSLHSRTQGS